VPALRALLEKYFAAIAPEVGAQDAGESAALYVQEPARSWIAFVDAAPAGCVGLRPLSEHSSEIKHLYVGPAYRGKHVGRALLEAVHEHARSAGIEEVYLDSLPSMSAARRLYQQMGYVDTERYYKDDVHRVFMRLDLR
jgi:GNAT superfamily N-acetyltransferase